MELKKRSSFPEKELWDLTALYKDRKDFLLAIEKALEDVKTFKKTMKDTYRQKRILNRPFMNLSTFTSK